jgi:hypothetical protein
MATTDRASVLVVIETECGPTGCEAWEIRRVPLPI